MMFGVGCGAGDQHIAPPLNLPLAEEEKPSGGTQGASSSLPPLLASPRAREETFRYERTDFSEFNPIFRFFAEVPRAWKIEYVPEIEAISIYDPAIPGENAREQSQIFIRYFEANDFLTLRTVDILEREQFEVRGHPAVRYVIRKKDGVPDFPRQPSWRNAKHTVVDVRLTVRSPSRFYVFGKNPELAPDEFEKFLSSLVFHNDEASFVSPLSSPRERISKKPFGLYVSPENSPVAPERFSGYHTAIDFEVFESEKDAPVQVRAFCGGKVREKRVADGYGGVLAQECLLGGQAVTVVYGHLKIQGVPARVGEYLAPGEKLGILGAGGTAETDGERKHLHFGIHKGTNVDIRGYVTRETELDQWLDPLTYFK